MRINVGARLHPCEREQHERFNKHKNLQFHPCSFVRKFVSCFGLLTFPPIHVRCHLSSALSSLFDKQKGKKRQKPGHNLYVVKHILFGKRQNIHKSRKLEATFIYLHRQSVCLHCVVALEEREARSEPVAASN